MKRLLLSVLCCCFLLAGCWDQRELNEIAIAVALGIDKSDEGFRVSAQVVVPSEISMNTSSGRSPVTLYQAEGETIFEVIRKLTKESPRKIYPGHLKVVVISEEFAKEGIRDSMDLLVRDWEVRSDYSVVVARDLSAEEILSVTTTIDKIPANKLFDALEKSEENWSSTHRVTMQEFLEGISTDGREAVLSGVLLTAINKTGEENMNIEQILPGSRLYYDGLSIFKNDRLIGWLNDEESKDYNYVTGSVKNTVEVLACPNGGKVSIEVTKADAKIEAGFRSGEPEMKVKIKTKGSIGSVLCDIDVKDPGTIRDLEQIFEEELTQSIKQTIATVQSRYGSDVFGFGQVIYRSNPDEWRRLKDNWSDRFSELPVDVQVKMEIKRTGTMLNSVTKKPN